MDENKYKFWDIVIKGVAALLTTGTIVIAIVGYYQNKNAELQQRQREYQKEISLRQLNYYTELAEAIGELLDVMAYPDSLYTHTYNQRKGRFIKEYYGKMNLIEDSAVNKALANFNLKMEDFEKPESHTSIYDLRAAAYTLYTTCAETNQKTWY